MRRSAAVLAALAVVLAAAPVSGAAEAAAQAPDQAPQPAPQRASQEDRPGDLPGGSPGGTQGDLPAEITARGAVLWDPADDAVLWGRAAREPRPMASTTKILTVLLALEAGAVDDIVTVSVAAARTGGASLGLFAGQRIPMRSVLAGLVLRSGNDAAVAVAEHVAGSEEAFVARMNARARELGLDGTRFVNASGLTDDLGHHAAPLDLARLAHVAMGHEEFAAWAGSEHLTVADLAPMTSRNELLGRYRGATGVKTGFTELSRYSLVASAERDGLVLYAVVLGSEDNFGDATRLLDYGFSTFRRVEPLDAGDAIAYRWAHERVDLRPERTLGATVASTAEVTWRTLLVPSIRPPVRAGQALGSAQLLADGRIVAETALRSARAVAVADSPSPGGAGAVAVHEALRAFVRLTPIDRAA